MAVVVVVAVVVVIFVVGGEILTGSSGTHVISQNPFFILKPWSHSHVFDPSWLKTHFPFKQFRSHVSGFAVDFVVVSAIVGFGKSEIGLNLNLKIYLTWYLLFQCFFQVTDTHFSIYLL